MKTRIFGRLNFEVSEISFGGAAVSGEGRGYGFGPITEDESLSLLRHSFERGINLFDTAPIYGFGMSEQRIGKAFKHIREKVYIVSKSGVTWHANKRVDMSNDPIVTQNMLEQSLRDLQSDYIDLYMIHWPDKLVDIRRPMEVLAKAKSEGKIGAIGLCNTNKDDLKSAQSIERVDIVQSEFNFFQDSVKELFPLLEKDEIGFMSWGTLDKGILSGRVNKERVFKEEDCRSWAPWWDKDLSYKKAAWLEKVRPKLEENDIDGLSLALSHNLNHTSLSTCLCGARNLKQLESLLNAYERKVSLDLINELKGNVKL